MSPPDAPMRRPCHDRFTITTIHLGDLMKKLVSLLGCVGFVLATALVAAPAEARPSPCTTPTCHTGPRYSIVGLTSSSGVTLTQLGSIASCKNTGGRCTISRGTSRTTTVGVSFGLSKGAVSSMIKVDSSKSSSTSVSCTSPTLKKGQIYRAYVRGVHKSYKIKRVYAGQTSTSSTKHAYEPYRTSITCRVESA